MNNGQAEQTIAEKKAARKNGAYDQRADDDAMYAQYGVHTEGQNGNRPSRDVADALVNAILDEELSKARAEETGVPYLARGEDETPVNPVQMSDRAPVLPEELETETYYDEEYQDNMAKKKKKNGGKITAIIIGALVLVVALAYAALFVIDSGKIVDNITVAGIDVGGMSKEEATAAIGAVAGSYGQNDMVLHFVDEDIVLTPQESGVVLNVENAVKAAYGYGRLLGVSIPGYTKAPAEPTAIDPGKYLTLNEEGIKALLRQKADTAISELTQPTVEVEDDTMTAEEEITDEAGNAATETVEKKIQIMTITMGTAERSLDVDMAYDQILDAYSCNDFASVEIAYDETLPDPVDVQELYDVYCTPAEDAYYDMESYEIVPHVMGYGFDLEEVTQQVEAAKEGDVLTVTLQEIEPEVTEEKLRESLFADVLASYDSPHTAIPARTENLRLACEAIDGTVLNPGDVFSFNDVVGERTADKGYQAAAVYTSGTTRDELGGGVCQVSSTIYMCALLADLEIVDRDCHQFTVTYVPMGMDATVYWGHQDFQFRNNTDYPIRIDASVSGGYVHVSLTGTETKDYTVEMSYEILSTTYPTTIERVITDGSYSNGEVIQAAHTGYKVVTYKHKLDKNGNEISCEVEAYSTYNKTDRIVAVVQQHQENNPDGGGGQENNPDGGGGQENNPDGEGAIPAV